MDREAGFVRFAGWSVHELLDRFASTRHANLDELAALLGPGDLDRRGVQIVKTMAKQYGDAVGPWRAFLPLLDVP